MRVDERIYLEDDPWLQVKAEPDPEVRTRHLARYDRAIELTGKTGGTWLDCACGSGYGSVLMAGQADYVYALDFDQLAVMYAVKHHYHRDINYIQAEIKDVVYWVGHVGGFDAILSIETLEHVSLLEQRAWVRDAAGLLKPDGVFVACCPIGTGPSANPWHRHEPNTMELAGMLGYWFGAYDITTEEYESTSGPATQAYAVGRLPRQYAKAA